MDFEKTAGGVLLPAAAVVVGGIFTGQILREGQIIDEFDVGNIVVDQGLNHLLNVAFNGATQINPWFLGLFEGNYTPVAGVNAATIVGASTECIAYSEATRPEFIEVASTAKSITNSAAKATFTFTSNKTIYGAFLISDATKSGTAGTLFSAAKFAAAKAVVATDQLLLTYTFTAASA